MRSWAKRKDEAKMGAAVMDAMNVRAALREAMAQLAAAGVPSSALAAELLLTHALGRDRAWIYSHGEEDVAAAALENFGAMVGERARGVPAQYLTGKQEFWGLEFEVTPAVLIPRPETEHVLEVALERLGPAPRNTPLRIADIGTGSGCIAVALARELPYADIVASDISADAIEVARRNAARHSVADRVQFIESDLFAAFGAERPATTQCDAQWRAHGTPEKNAGWQPALRTFDAIVSNPPYISLGEGPALQREVRAHEPRVALFAGEDGLAVYAPLIRGARDFLKPGGLLVLELGHGSLPLVGQIIERTSGWADVRVTNDLAGIPRVISAILAAA